MAGDVHEQVFNEAQFYSADVVGEDGELPGLSLNLPPLARNSGSTPSRPSRAAALSSSSDAREPGGRTGQTQSSTVAEAGTTSLTPAAARGARRKKRAAERAIKIMFWLETKYDVLPEVCLSFENWKEAASSTSDFDLLWCDTAIAADRFMKLKLYQKMNHFVGMSSITRKNNLGRNLLRMRKQFPKEYKFFPDTWILPTDLSDFKQQFNGKKQTFIIKPDNGCQGKGIFLVREMEKVPVDFSTTYVAQRYLQKPFLLDGFKFDLRLYVLVSGCDPLRIFLHKHGLVRLASEPYQEPSGKNLAQSMVHLTNYAINKFNPNFEENRDPTNASDGHKRSWEAVQNHLRKEGHDVDTLLSEIEDLIVKTLIAVQPSLSHFYHSCQPEDIENSMCFEVLGFDVMLDHKLQPWLLEVNHAPSFATESELDRLVKTEVLHDTFNLLDMNPEARRQKKRDAKEKMELRAMGVSKKATVEERSAIELEVARARTVWEDERLGSYKRLYPSEAKEREYYHIHDAAINIWEMLMGGTSRRTVRLGLAPPDADDKDGGGSANGGAEKLSGRKTSKGPEEKKEKEREKRTPQELKEVVERLMNGCSAHPRPSENRVKNKAGEKDGEGEEKEEEPPAVTPLRNGRPDVKVGDVIKVQTNLGWENVTVRAKRTNGKLDIQFKDGEYMRSVLPRILREDPSPPPGGGDSTTASSGEGGPYASASSSSSTEVPTVGGVGVGGSLPSGASAVAAALAAVSGSGFAPTLPPSPSGPSAGAHSAAQVFGGGSSSAAAIDAAVAPHRSYHHSGSLSAVVGPRAAAAAAAAAAVGLASYGSEVPHLPTNGVQERDSNQRTSTAPSVPFSDESVATGNQMMTQALTTLDSQLAAHLRLRRNRTGQVAGGPLLDEPGIPLPGSTVAGGGGARAAAAFRKTGPTATAWHTSSQDPLRTQEVRLRSQLQHLINVRPIVARRGSAMAGPTGTGAGAGAPGFGGHTGGPVAGLGIFGGGISAGGCGGGGLAIAGTGAVGPLGAMLGSTCSEAER